MKRKRDVYLLLSRNDTCRETKLKEPDVTCRIKCECERDHEWGIVFCIGFMKLKVGSVLQDNSKIQHAVKKYR